MTARNPLTRIALVTALAGVAAVGTGQADGAGRGSAAQQEGRMNITVSVEGGERVGAVLGGGVAARDFVRLLPLTVTLKDYASTEKVADLPKPLSTAGEPNGFDPEPGDITFYSPWGNLAIFYKNFGFARGLVSLGRLDHVPDAFRRPGPVTITIERR